MRAASYGSVCAVAFSLDHMGGHRLTSDLIRDGMPNYPSNEVLHRLGPSAAVYESQREDRRLPPRIAPPPKERRATRECPHGRQQVVPPRGQHRDELAAL